MIEYPGLYFARRLRSLYELSFPVTSKELAAVCADRGVLIRVAPETFGKLGLYLLGPVPMIVLRQGVGRMVLSHELLHHLARECDPQAGRCEERECRRFAWLLCSGSERAARLLGVAESQEPERGLSTLRSRLPANGTESISERAASLIYTWAPRPRRSGGQASTRAQIRDCRVRADAEDLPPARVFVDYAVPPFAAHERAEGSVLCQQAAQWRREGVSALYVAHLSRLGPSRFFRAPLIAAVESAGLELRSLELPYWGTFYR